MSATDGTLIEIMDAMATLEQRELASVGLQDAFGHTMPTVITMFPFSMRWIDSQGGTYAPEGGSDSFKGGEYGAFTAGTTTTTYYINVFLGIANADDPDIATQAELTYPYERAFKNAYIEHGNIGRTCHSSRVHGFMPATLKIGPSKWFGLLYTVSVHTQESTAIAGND